MKKLLSKKMKWRLCLFLSFLILFYTTGCNYFKVNTTGTDSLFRIDGMQKDFIIHNQVHTDSSDQVYWMISPELTPNSLKGQLSEAILDTIIQAVPISAYSKKDRAISVVRTDPYYYSGRKKRYQRDERQILQEVHIYTSQSAIAAGQVEIPLEDIREVRIIDKASGKTTASYFFGTIGVIVTTFTLLLILFPPRITTTPRTRTTSSSSSSCPYIYTYDGESYLFQGEIYGGAIQRNLERPDFMPLPQLQPADGEYHLLLSNELKERQYTNLAELVVVNHPAGSEVLLDSRGRPQLFSNPVPPRQALSEGGAALDTVLAAADRSPFLFNEEGVEDNAVHLSFIKPEGARTARLLLNAKNTLWLEYLYGEFAQNLGGYYNTWIEKRSQWPAEVCRQQVVEQEFPLSIYLNTSEGWELVEYLPTIGPMAARDFAIPIDLSKVSGEQVDIRLQTGFFFWEVDYAAMDFTNPQALDTRRVPATLAVDQDGTDRRAELAVDDESYFTQPKPGMVAELHFPAIPVPGGEEQSVFLHTKGYYEHVRDYSGLPNFFELRKFREPGHFSDFSRAEYLRLLEKVKEGLVLQE